MVKQIIACCLVLAFSLQAFNTAIILADYRFNTKAYLEKCENKAKPKLHCLGKCQMKKKLEQEEKNDQQNPERKGENKSNLSLFSQSLDLIVFSVFNQVDETAIICLVAGDCIHRSSAIFHPPKGC